MIGCVCVRRFTCHEVKEGVKRHKTLAVGINNRHDALKVRLSLHREYHQWQTPVTKINIKNRYYFDGYYKRIQLNQILLIKKDTVKLDTVKLDTVKIDTVKADTVKIDTIEINTIKIDTVKKILLK